jgi:enediyne biosynthesis protein E4
MKAISLFVLLCAATQAQAAPVTFKAEAQVNSVFSGETDFMVGGGVAVFDCNADGYADMLLSGGEGKATFYRNVSSRGSALKFESATSGLELDRVLGTYPLDVDSDGNVDLVLLRSGENVVLRGLGNCKFARANETWAFDGGDAWSTSFAAIWEQGASWPTVAIGNYIDRHEELNPWGSCTDNWLHRPGGASGFAKPLALKPSFCPLSILFTDWNRSGTPSLRVSNDRQYYEGGQEQMWRMEPGKAPVLYSEAEGWKYLRIWGMGISSYDLNFDQYPDYFLTSMADNKLQVLDKTTAPLKPGYKDVAYARKATAHRPHAGEDLRPSTAWHTQFDDVDNDGLVDLFIAKGNVDAMPDFAQADPNNLLLQNGDGTFREMSGEAGVASIKTSRGAALADFNLDGLLDLVVVNRKAPAELWRNTTANAGRWLQVKLYQPGPNRDAIGAWIEIKRGDHIMRREVFSGGGHASGQNGWWHFGLGQAETAEVRVLWPHGKPGPWHRVNANQFIEIAPDSSPTPWLPAR